MTPGKPGLFETRLSSASDRQNLSVIVGTAEGRTLLAPLLAYTPKVSAVGKLPPPATEPGAPSEINSGEELFLIGLHLEQYRHATRMAEDYWREGLRRDPGDSRCHLALGRWHLRRGEFDAAENHLRASIARLTSRNPNPYEGEAYYQLGCCLRQRAFAAAALTPRSGGRDLERRTSGVTTVPRGRSR